MAGRLRRTTATPMKSEGMRASIERGASPHLTPTGLSVEDQHSCCKIAGHDDEQRVHRNSHTFDRSNDDGSLPPETASVLIFEKGQLETWIARAAAKGICRKADMPYRHLHGARERHGVRWSRPAIFHQRLPGNFAEFPSGCVSSWHPKHQQLVAISRWKS